MLRGPASDADELASVLDHAHAPRLPGGSKLLGSVGKGACRVGAFAIGVVPAEAHLVGEALVPDVSLLAAAEADLPGAVAFQEGGDDVTGGDDVHVPALGSRGGRGYILAHVAWMAPLVIRFRVGLFGLGGIIITHDTQGSSSCIQGEKNRIGCKRVLTPR